LNELLRRVLFLPPQGSTLARAIDGLHYFVIISTMLGALLVTLVGGWFLIRYRRARVDAHPEDYDVHARPPLWMKIGAVGGLFILFVIWWSIGIRQYLELRVAPAGSLEIYVTAKQWMWKFAYPEGGRTLSVLYVPAGRPVKLILTSRDVIHSFYVPDFRIKQDAIPGRYTTQWFEAKAPGVYEILCAEYCGTGHSMMRGQVVALDPGEFDRWLGGADLEKPVEGQAYVPPWEVGQTGRAPEVDLAVVGERAAATQGCLRCHSIDGTPHIGPTWAGLFGSVVPLSSGETVIADGAYLTESIMDPMAKLHRGFPPLMPSYLGKIRPGEVAAILAFMRSLRDVEAEPAAPTQVRDGGAP
jgi:cytochrome c oxidase subunit II